MLSYVVVNVCLMVKRKKNSIDSLSLTKNHWSKYGKAPKIFLHLLLGSTHGTGIVLILCNRFSGFKRS